MPQLDPTWYVSQFFWLCLSFFTLYYIMSHFIAPRIADILEKRQNKIDDYLNKAQETKGRAETALENYNEAMKEATKKANEILENSKQDLENLIDKRQKKLVQALQDKMQQNEAKIVKSREEVMANVCNISEELAHDILFRMNLPQLANENLRKTIEKVAKN